MTSKHRNEGKARPTPTTSVDTVEGSSIPSTAAPTEASTNTESNTLEPENIQLGNQENSGSTADNDDPFELPDIEVPDDISETRVTLKELLDIQELQLRKLLAIKRHIQQNPIQAGKHETRPPDMKKILDARAAKINDLKSIIDACDTIRAASNRTDYTDPNAPRKPQEAPTATRTNGNRSYQQPAFLNIPSHWPRFRKPGGIANMQQFFDAFKRQVVPAINPEALLRDGPRYLGILIHREEDVDAFNDELKEGTVERYNVDTLELSRTESRPLQITSSLVTVPARVGLFPLKAYRLAAIVHDKAQAQVQNPNSADTTPIVSLTAAIQALAAQQLEQQRQHQQYQSSIQLYKGDDGDMSFAEFKSKLTTSFVRFSDSLHTDQEKIDYALQSMEGPPAVYFAPYVNGEAKDLDGFLVSFPTFLVTMDSMYGDQHHTDEINHKLARICQTGSMSEYISKLCTLATHSGWNEPALLGRFKEGLSDDVKSLLTAQLHALTSLREAQAAATTAY
ncbi:hypothetical protein BGZ75_000967 [Mortierella antarctica]|nr:hypothetical protein BGZ75_000967 [Mortierella antarctica]